jgi:hypothetical protein
MPRKRGFVDDKVAMLHRNFQARILALEHYGGANYKCACCPESEFSFLTIDHIDGEGNEDRKRLVGDKLAAGHHFYRKLKELNFPDGYQVLCMNCQVGRRDNSGVCPHKGAALTPQERLEKFEVLRVGEGHFERTLAPEYQAALEAVKRKGDARPSDLELRRSRRKTRVVEHD